MRSYSVGTRFQFCKMKSFRNLLHNKVPTSNTAKSTMVKMVHVCFYHHKKTLSEQEANKLGYLRSISWLRALTHSTLRGSEVTPVQNYRKSSAICDSCGDLWVAKDLGRELMESDTSPTFEFWFPCL